MPSIRITAALAVFLAGLTLGAAQAAEPTGTWLTEKGDAHIRISHCGNRLCGTIAWVKDKIDPKTGKPPVDSDNPNPRLRHRRIVPLTPRHECRPAPSSCHEACIIQGPQSIP
ncbi:MAG TPA: DUF2147 domain-containing protein, partial [Pseudolabrys sp.]|nr:DUF2147 domain-containing protein [Pseudolabrys sp.]